MVIIKPVFFLQGSLCWLSLGVLWVITAWNILCPCLVCRWFMLTSGLVSVVSWL